MNNITRNILYSVLLAYILAGCAQKESATNTLENVRINFLTHAGSAAKAFSPVTEISSFRVYGLRNAGAQFINGDIYPTSFSYFWPQSGNSYENLFLLGIYPTGIPVSDDSRPGCCRKVLDLTLTGNEDILTFATGYIGMRPSVDAYFQHILNRLAGFSFKALNDDVTSIRIDGITMKNVPTRVNLAEEMFTDGSYAQTAVVLSAADRNILDVPVTGDTPTACSIPTDFSFLPGTYTISIDYSIRKSGITQSYSRSASLFLGDLAVEGTDLPHQGVRYTVECILGDNISMTAVGTSINMWAEGGASTEDFN